MQKNVNGSTPLQILLIERREGDTSACLDVLQHAGYQTSAARVTSEQAYLDTLNERLDLILARAEAPSPDPERALDLLHKDDLDVPLIVLDGAYTPERAERLIRAGAADCVSQDQLPRLVHAVAKAQQERKLRAVNRQLEAALTQLERTQEKAIMQERLAAVGQLAAGVAHDFNNLLSAVLLNCELMMDRPDLPDEAWVRAATIRDQAQRAASLTSQILDFSRRSVLERRPLDLAALMHECLLLLERTLPENIELVLDHASEPMVVEADPDRLHQMFVNLALNARDAMPRGGRLICRVAKVRQAPGDTPLYGDMSPGEWVRIEVEDTGTGILPENLPHIFEPFFTTKPPGQGSGLGLSQVYGIVKKHEGYIDVASEPGVGTTFTIYLPELEALALEEIERPATEKSEGDGATVLVVEDDAPTRVAVCETLEMLGYTPVPAEDGLEGLELVEQLPDVRLVLADMIMPAMDGVDLWERLREARPEVPVVLVTGYPLQEALRARVEAGELTWVQKPLDLETLERVVREALGE
jgi:two-component system cell cycle sensor histidine kinase/response regulator CckA